MRSISNFQELVPKANNRAALIGTTGTGKTWLAHRLVSTRRNVIALDTKGYLNWGDFRVYNTLKSLVSGSEPKRIFRPNIHQMTDEIYEMFFEFIYKRQKTTVYVDEVLDVCENAHTIPFYYKACLTRGRERQVETWSATQRPAGIPQTILSESENNYCFRLNLPPDRDRVENMWGVDEERIASLADYQFIYSNYKFSSQVLYIV